jgi:hypothetical protein
VNVASAFTADVILIRSQEMRAHHVTINDCPLFFFVMRSAF